MISTRGTAAHRAALAAVTAFVVAAFSAGALAQDAFTFERTLEPTGIGAHRASLDVDLLVGAAPVRYAADSEEALPIGGLEDLRLWDGAGQEVPYLLMLPAAKSPREIAGRLAPIRNTKEESGFEVDLGAMERIDRVSIRGLRPPVLKRYHLEGSGDRQRWIVLVDAGTVFDLPDEGLTRMHVDLLPTDLRYLRWTWSDASSARVPLPLSVTARRVEDARPAQERLSLDFQRRPSEPRISRFRVRLPGRHLPMARLEFEVAPGDLSRPVRVQEPRLTGDLVEPVVLGQGLLRRSARMDGIAAVFSVPLDSAPIGDELEIVVDDGDNPPLELVAVRARLRALPWIYFESVDGRTLTARWGRKDAVAPRYDLEASRHLARQSVAAMAAWGPTRRRTPESTTRTPDYESAALGSTIDLQRFDYARSLPATTEGMNRLVLDLAVLAHSRLRDLRIVTPTGQQVAYLLERLEEPLTTALKLQQIKKDAHDTSSRYRLELPYDGLPPSRVVLETSARVFDRTVLIWEIRTGEGAAEPLRRHLSQRRWMHADPALPALDLVIDLPQLSGRKVEIEIEEGDNQTLPLRAASLLVPSWRLRFFGGLDDLRLVYGDPSLSAPRYDLALLGPRLVGTEGHEVALGPEHRMRAAESDATDSPRIFWILLAVSVVGLLGLLARLLRHPGGPQSGQPEP